MKVILLGDAGAGKNTLSKKLIAKHPAAPLSLDEVAFQGGTERRPLQDSIEDVKRWIADNESWIIEGCYSDIIEPLLAFYDELMFLNPRGRCMRCPLPLKALGAGKILLPPGTRQESGQPDPVGSLLREAYRRIRAFQTSGTLRIISWEEA